MNQVQLAIILVISIVILAIVVYYIYQEHKFKKLIENNFSQVTEDVIQQEQGLVFENQEDDLPTGFQLSQKDKVKSVQELGFDLDPLLDDQRLNDHSAENDAFIKYDRIIFTPQKIIDDELDHVIDVVLESATKIKVLPEICQFISKPHVYYILDKNGSWQLYDKAQKYVINGFKVVFNLVDVEGVLSTLQVNNAYNELAKFALHHNGHIRQLDPELKMRKIQQQLKHLANVPLELELFMTNKDELNFRNLSKYFLSNSFVNNNNIFDYQIDDLVVFSISDEKGNPFEAKSSYFNFMISSKLHHLSNPLLAIEKIFDFAEHYVEYFEARLLTSNKMAMNEKEYYTLEKQVSAYMASNKRQSIKLGSKLIQRLYP